jgi:hypothetical protein
MSRPLPPIPRLADAPPTSSTSRIEVIRSAPVAAGTSGRRERPFL